jgi:hypothetical protein
MGGEIAKASSDHFITPGAVEFHQGTKEIKALTKSPHLVSMAEVNEAVELRRLGRQEVEQTTPQTVG